MSGETFNVILSQNKYNLHNRYKSAKTGMCYKDNNKLCKTNECHAASVEICVNMQIILILR
jgi:hypothetical protein